MNDLKKKTRVFMPAWIGNFGFLIGACTVVLQKCVESPNEFEAVVYVFDAFEKGFGRGCRKIFVEERCFEVWGLCDIACHGLKFQTRGGTLDIFELTEKVGFDFCRMGFVVSTQALGDEKIRDKT